MMEHMKKNNGAPNKLGPWTGHVLRMYRKEMWENLLFSIALGIIIVPCALMVVVVPIKAIYLWVTGESLPELPYPNFLMVGTLYGMVSVFVVMSFSKHFIRSIKDTVVSIRVRNMTNTAPPPHTPHRKRKAATSKKTSCPRRPRKNKPC